MDAFCREFDGAVWLTGPSLNDSADVRSAAVSPEVVPRCSVLSCIAESAGEAQLPWSVTISDFEIWNACNSLEPIDCKKFDFQTLCTLMMV